MSRVKVEQFNLLGEPVSEAHYIQGDIKYRLKRDFPSEDQHLADVFQLFELEPCQLTVQTLNSSDLRVWVTRSDDPHQLMLLEPGPSSRFSLTDPALAICYVADINQGQMGIVRLTYLPEIRTSQSN